MGCYYVINQAFIDSTVMQRASRDAFDATRSWPFVSLWLLFLVVVADFKAQLVINNTSIIDR